MFGMTQHDEAMEFHSTLIGDTDSENKEASCRPSLFVFSVFPTIAIASIDIAILTLDNIFVL